MYSIHTTITVHLPDELLHKLDQRAKELGLSRNRYVVRALEAAVREETAWSPRFLEMLAGAAKDADGGRTVDEMIHTISSRRTRKAPPKL